MNYGREQSARPGSFEGGQVPTLAEQDKFKHLVRKYQADGCDEESAVEIATDLIKLERRDAAKKGALQ